MRITLECRYNKHAFSNKVDYTWLRQWKMKMCLDLKFRLFLYIEGKSFKKKIFELVSTLIHLQNEGNKILIFAIVNLNMSTCSCQNPNVTSTQPNLNLSLCFT